MLKKCPKLSVIITVYNKKKYIERAILSLINCTYFNKNMEIVIVNDSSNDGSDHIINTYSNKYSNIISINHNENRGLFISRITGIENSTGDYIAFLDADDHVSIDFYRTLIDNAVLNNSDIVFGNTVFEYNDSEKSIFNLANLKFDVLNNYELLDLFLKQECNNYLYHVVWNKIYSKKLWNKALNDLKITAHLVQTEDIAFSTVLFYYAQKVTRVENDAIFYNRNDECSTSSTNVSFENVMKNLEDINFVLNYIEDFLKSKDIFNKYIKNIANIRCLYKYIWNNILVNSKLRTNDNYNLLEEKLFCISSKDTNVENLKNNYDYFYSLKTNWNDNLEKIKESIVDPNIKVVSFDIFDTLILRPFYEPKDLFELLDETFREVTNTDIGVDFHKIRVLSESITRKKICTQGSIYQDITLDQIYDTIVQEYNIDKYLIEKIKQKEIEYELKFCSQRKTGFELYDLALSMNKTVIISSDMYLPKTVIVNILDKNGYTEFKKLFLSSEIKVTKSSGDMYSYIINDLNIMPQEMLHIGDNYQSDCINANEKNISYKLLTRTIDVMRDCNLTNNCGQIFLKDLPDWHDNKAAIYFLGIRSMIAVTANKYFDNPYISFSKESDFNGDPYFIGYYALGMELFGITKWMIDNFNNNNYDNIVFMARDGYLPMKAYELMKVLYKNLPNSKYFYVSRKALIPVGIFNELDFYKLSEIINIYKHTPGDFLKCLQPLINTDNNKISEIFRDGKIDLNKNFNDMLEYNIFVKRLLENLYDKEKHKNYIHKVKTYFKTFYTGNSCTFDIGYSGRPETIISKLCDKPIDTYFININHNEAKVNSKIGNYKLETFFDYKPKFTGFIRELLISSQDASCINYYLENDEIFPVFQEYNYNYTENYSISEVQRGSLDFIRDMVDIFGNEIEKLYYQNYYISLPLEMYIHSSRHFDKMVFNALNFEDSVGLGKDLSTMELWDFETKYHNQYENQYLFDKMDIIKNPLSPYDSLKVYKRNKIVKLLYYLLFDRYTLKCKINNRFSKGNVLIKLLKKNYRLLKKFRDWFYTKF